MKAMYHSCYICDVKIDNEKKLAVLTDSSQRQYYVELSDNTYVESFKTWFNCIFCKGIAQTLTVFQYITKDISECESETYIIKFMNLPNHQKTFV